MATSTTVKMVNGRVDERAVERASRVLKQQGLTLSAFIRNSIEHVARTGTIPECGKPEARDSADLDSLRALVHKIESFPMPGKSDYPDLGEDELIERMRMERYGY